MMTIYKYPIQPQEDKPNLIEMPEGATVLAAATDGMGELCIWALVDTTKAKITKKVWCVGTGWDLAAIFNRSGHIEIQFIDTVREGFYMWHVMEEK